MARAITMPAPAMAPWAQRTAIRASILCTRAATVEVMANPRLAKTSTRRRPKVSLSVP
jgi:hypothetical protein